MTDAIIVAIVSGIFTLIGSFAGAVCTMNLTQYRLQKLEEKVDKHNNVVERMFRLEGRVTEAEHDIRDIKQKG